MAAISPDYYARIEQGRRDAPWATLDAIARALRLNPAERDYLFELSSTDRPRRRRAQQPSAHLQRLLDGLPGIPALVLGRRMDILAWNSMASRLITDFATIPEKQRNYVRLVFTDPAMRSLYSDWGPSARECVAQLHMEVAHASYDPRLAQLVGELSVLDPDFRRWWSEHQVAIRSRGVKTFHHPHVGDITLDWDTLTYAADPEQQLISWTADPNTPSFDKLQQLARQPDSERHPDRGRRDD